MLRKPARVASRRLLLSARSSTSRRFLATGPAARPRSWKSSAVRWGLAAGVVWVYGSSKVFAEEEEAAIQKLERTVHSELSHFQTNLDASEGAHAHTVEAVVESRRKAREAAEAEEIKKRSQAEQSKAAPTSESSGIAHSEGANDGEAPTGDVQGLEEEADQQGAFNPETGEINWDCPCLGGMAHGPCGPEFKEAFSCFVHSTEDPKGMECIDKFKHMQDCFRAHPEVYPSEFEDEDEEGEEATAAELESDGHHVAKDAPIAPRKTTVEQTPKAEHDGQDKASEDSGKVVQQLDTSIDNPLPPQSHDATSK